MSAALVGLRELDARIAVALGWEPFVTCGLEHEGPCGPVCRVEHWKPVSTNLDVCRLAEIEMDRRGLWCKYLAAVLLDMGIAADTAIRGASAYAKSDAETRCRAMLRCLEVQP